jgi:hypothetical protein
MISSNNDQTELSENRTYFVLKAHMIPKNVFSADLYYNMFIGNYGHFKGPYSGLAYLLKDEFALYEYDPKIRKQILGNKYVPIYNKTQWLQSEMLVYDSEKEKHNEVLAGGCMKTEKNQPNLLSKSNEVTEDRWMKTARWVFLSKTLFAYYEHQYQRDYQLIVERFMQKVKEERNVLYKLLVISGEEYNINTSSEYDQFSHIQEFLPYESRYECYFSAIVTIEPITYHGNRKTFNVRLRVNALQSNIPGEVREEIEVGSEENGEDTIVNITFPWYYLVYPDDIRSPECYLNDGGCLNCYGCYDALFVPLSEYTYAKEQYELHGKRRRDASEVISDEGSA